MKIFIKLLITPFILIFGLLFGLFCVIYKPIECVVDYWRDQL